MHSPHHVEIERKFLVTGDGWRGHGEGIRYRQGYLAISNTATVRVRIGGGAAYLTLKGRPTSGSLVRPEYEYDIPTKEAEEIIEVLCDGRVVEKTRYRIPYSGSVWDVDEFHGRHSGLIIAEIELQHENETFQKPTWIGDEVTGDYRYSNAWFAQQAADDR